MHLDDVRGVVTVARTGHVGAAADELGISQSALTRRLQRVEAQLGASLFDRGGRSMTLNARGVVFVEEAENMLAAEQRACTEVCHLMDPERGTVRLDFMHSLGTWLVPELLRTYRAQHPQVEFVLHQGAAQELIDRVQAGAADIALVGPRPRGLAWHRLEMQRLGLAVPSGHWAAGRAAASMEEFRNEPFIGMLPGYGTRMLLDQLAQRAGFSPRLVFESMELTTVAGLVAAGLGVALLPVDDPYLQVGELVPLEPPAYRELGFTWRPGSPAADQFADFIKSYSRAHPR
ncbi:LysR family transcriptional regulator [Corynebacterium lizhenjunii]|uniref:LysR family transcriptional regulator n=1 Tax=Corynebacterium lizhenjunii TaxID=2709394 RepID=A0A7T0KE00_9CORY|nr:LysR family transcriptional regulator [Corynebacterium lizhenjunii]QPK79041.1 LysR family transcriptional regulator [Corynebacterium lizhenjunii]